MPAKLTLLELQHAMEIEEVKLKLDSYAIGVLVNEQNKSRKTLSKTQTTIKTELQELDKTSQIYQDKIVQLNALKDQPDLGFYYTISLFDRLAETHPREAKKMIEAVLSFDTMGHYLLEERAIIIDGSFFVLNNVLQKLGITSSLLKDTAKQNQLNTVYISDDTKPMESLITAPPPFSLPANIDELPETTNTALKRLHRLANAAGYTAALKKRVTSVTLDFNQVSQSPTKKNIDIFLCLLTELFAHAKMQDSAKLDTLNTAKFNDSQINAYSTVAFLQNTLSSWLLLSLLQASTATMFNQRIRFIMATFAEANKKSPHLPSNANADMYLPLFILSNIVTESVLTFHPAIKPNLKIILKLAAQHNAMSITKYTNEITLTVGKKKMHLTPMRMQMTTELALGAEMASFVDHDASAKAAYATATESIARGEAIYHYFNPEHRDLCQPLTPMSAAARALFNDQSTVQWLFEGNTDPYDIADLLITAFAIHQQDDDVGKQLLTFECALFNQNPRVFSQRKYRKLACYEGHEALDYIEKKVTKTQSETPKISRAGAHYINAISLWCEAILTKITLLKSPLMHIEPHSPHMAIPIRGDDGAKHLRRLTIFKGSSESKIKQPTTATERELPENAKPLAGNYRISMV